MNDNEHKEALKVDEVIEDMIIAVETLTAAITEITSKVLNAAYYMVVFFKRLQFQLMLAKKGFPIGIASAIAKFTPARWLPEINPDFLDGIREEYEEAEEEENHVEYPPPGSFPFPGVTQEQWTNALKESSRPIASMEHPTLMSITEVPLICLVCDWSGTVGTAEPDCDGDGSLGCPDCRNILDSEWPKPLKNFDELRKRKTEKEKDNT